MLLIKQFPPCLAALNQKLLLKALFLLIHEHKAFQYHCPMDKTKETIHIIVGATECSFTVMWLTA